MTRGGWTGARFVLAGVLILLTGLLSVTAGPHGRSSATTPTLPGTFTSLPPTRILDTRGGLGAPAAPVGAARTLGLQVAGVAGVPAAGASAVVINLTVTAPGTSGYLTAYPDGSRRTRASSVNFAAHQTVANLVVVPLGGDGKIAIFNGSGGTVQLVVDVQGYYLAGAVTAAGAFASVTPDRVLDTRGGLGAPATPVRTRQTLAVQIAGVAGVPATGASAVVLNLTVTAPVTSGYATAFANGSIRGTASSVNFRARQTVANLVVVPLGPDGKIALFNGSGGTAQLVSDVQGYYLAGTPISAGTFTALPPTRVLDTRGGLGAPAAPIKAQRTLGLKVTGVAGVPAVGVSAVIINLTVTAPGTSGYLTAYPGGTVRSRASSLNFAARQTVANLVVVPVGPDGRIALYNGSGGSVQIVSDVQGYYLSSDLVTALTPPQVVPPQTSPAPISTSHYPRDLAAFTNTTIFSNMGSYDAPFNPSGHAFVVLMDIGGQSTQGNIAGVLLSATSQWVSNATLVTAMKAFIDGYTTAQRANAPVIIAIGTNNDVDVSSASGAVWANQVINPLASYASKYAGLSIAGANDMEPGFSATQAASQSWLSGYLANTSAQFVFNGSADGCPTAGGAVACNNGWTLPGLAWLSGGAAPGRIIGLPQVYNYVMPLQWKNISLNGVASHNPRIYFGGALTEYNACEPANQPCTSLDGNSAWTGLWNAIQSDARTSQTSLPYSTDLEINCYLRMPLCN